MLTGALLALVCPAIAWVIEYFLKYNTYIINRPAVPYLLAIALNLILVRVLLKKEEGNTSRGIMLCTFAIMLLLFIFQLRLR